MPISSDSSRPATSENRNHGSNPALNPRNNTANFGYREVAEGEKQSLVDEVFSSVAPRYDLMNDLMSFGLHRMWKRFAVACSGVRRDSSILDVAGGTGDITLALAKKIGPKGRIVLSDINESMLRLGQDRLIDQGFLGQVACVQTDAQQLAFAADSFDIVMVSFGLRNVTRIDKALASMHNVVRPCGRLVILEFSKPVNRSFNALYDAYSFKLIPRFGQLVAKDRESYQYLVESIRRHPDQETLADMMADAGFERIEYFNLSGGIVALHVGRKI